MTHPIINPAKLADAQQSAHNYIYSPVHAADALNAMADGQIVQLGEGMTLALPLDWDPEKVSYEDRPSVTLGEGTIVELVDMDGNGSWYRIYGAVAADGKAYGLSST